MDPDRPTRTGPEVLDEAALGALIRDVADDWQMPPQRLGEVTWRDRVGRPRSAGLRWTRRLAGATSLALVATVILAMAAVWLTAPRSDPSKIGATSSPSASAPGATATPGRTALPKLVRFGDALPSVTSVLVQDGGAYRVVDLTTGEVSSPLFPPHDVPYAVAPRPGGGWVCFCADYETRSVADPAKLVVTIEPTDAAGVRGDPIVARTFVGMFDPDAVPVEQPQAADAQVTLSGDGRLAFLGWSYRDATAGWVAGIDVIDLATLATVDTVTLPDADPAAGADQVWSRVAPSVAVSPAGDRLYVSSYWYVSTESSSVPSGRDHWTVTWDGHAGLPVPAGSTDGNTCSEWGAGFIDDATVYIVCWYGSDPAIERRDLAGNLVARDQVPGAGAGIETGSVMEVVSDVLYLWAPIDRQLTRYDLRTGEMTSKQAPLPTAEAGGDDLLAMVGRRIGDAIVPSVAAKVYLQPGLVVSPDGTRVYALGITSAGGTLGSQGVFVFDAFSLEPLDRWAPTADFGSMAISADGRSVYAAGGAGRDADGVGSADAASITVFDATSGSVLLIAGEVSVSDVWFPGPTVR